MKDKIRYYIAAVRWLWENRSWANTRQKWKAFDRAMRKYETRHSGQSGNTVTTGSAVMAF